MMGAKERTLGVDAELAQIVADAREIEDFETPSREPGRFECIARNDLELAAAIEVLIANGSEDDYVALADETNVYRVGRWLARRDEQGFWSLEERTSAEAASMELDSMLTLTEEELRDGQS